LRIFDLVDRAFDAALAAVRPGAVAGDVEEAHRRVFREAGMEDYALKGLGHGIGLEIHEHPRVVIGAKQPLKPGMVFTIEPGLYLPGRCGVRTEDDVLITEDGVSNLCSLPHKIRIAS
jgi:Xaa-Pro aminopeptidase/Xaa-Pro dipeptidase